MPPWMQRYLTRRERLHRTDSPPEDENLNPWETTLLIEEHATTLLKQQDVATQHELRGVRARKFQFPHPWLLNPLGFRR